MLVWHNASCQGTKCPWWNSTAVDWHEVEGEVVKPIPDMNRAINHWQCPVFLRWVGCGVAGFWMPRMYPQLHVYSIQWVYEIVLLETLLLGPCQTTSGVHGVRMGVNEFCQSRLKVNCALLPKVPRASMNLRWLPLTSAWNPLCNLHYGTVPTLGNELSISFHSWLLNSYWWTQKNFLLGRLQHQFWPPLLDWKLDIAHRCVVRGEPQCAYPIFFKIAGMYYRTAAIKLHQRTISCSFWWSSPNDRHFLMKSTSLSGTYQLIALCMLCPGRRLGF